MKLAINLGLEATISLLVLLIHRKALKEDGDGGKLIQNFEDLVTSRAHRFIGIGQEPLFRSFSADGITTQMSADSACHALNGIASLVGLPYARFHLIRHDFAQQASVAYTASEAKVLLMHEQKTDTLQKHYTGNISLYNLVALRSGELNPEIDGGMIDRLRHSLYEVNQLQGAAYECIAQQIASEADGTPDSKSVKSSSHRSYTARDKDVCERICQQDVAYMQLKADFEEIAASVKSSFGVVVTSGRSFNFQLKTLQRQMTSKPAQASAIMDGINKLIQARTCLTKRRTAVLNVTSQHMEAKSRAALRSKDRIQIKEASVTAAATEDPHDNISDKQAVITFKNMAEARTEIRRRALERTQKLSRESTHYFRLSASKLGGQNIHGDASFPTTKSIAKPSTKRRKSQGDGIQSSVVPGGPVLAASQEEGHSDEEEVDEEDFDDEDNSVQEVDTFSQKNVFTDANEEGSDSICAVRLGRIGFLLMLLQAPANLEALFKFIQTHRFCPFCRWGNRQTHSGRPPIGLFRRSNTTISVLGHMRRIHSSILAFMLTGRKVYAGTMESPQAPTYRMTRRAEQPALATALLQPPALPSSPSSPELRLNTRWLSPPPMPSHQYLKAYQGKGRRINMGKMCFTALSKCTELRSATSKTAGQGRFALPNGQQGTVQAFKWDHVGKNENILKVLGPLGLVVGGRLVEVRDQAPSRVKDTPPYNEKSSLL
jgi:hypothetical protein